MPQQEAQIMSHWQGALCINCHTNRTRKSVSGYYLCSSCQAYLKDEYAISNYPGDFTEFIDYIFTGEKFNE